MTLKDLNRLMFLINAIYISVENKFSNIYSVLHSNLNVDIQLLSLQHRNLQYHCKNVADLSL